MCVLCQEDTYNPVGLELLDEWWDQYATCLPCPPGTTSQHGATVCTDCQEGQYRQAGQLGCQNCTIAGYYARNSSSAGSCTACNRSCPVAYDQQPCPLNPGFYTCQPCPPAPHNANYWSNCLYTCDEGHYAYNDTCLACNTSVCEPGFNRSQCTAWFDSDCLEECQNESKPLWYSQWTTGCSWACDPGYTLAVKNYALFKLYECVPAQTSFWSSLFA